MQYQHPQPLPDLTFEQLWPYMARDKKADAESVRFVLLHDLAQPYLARVPEAALRGAFEAWREEVGGTGHAASVNG